MADEVRAEGSRLTGVAVALAAVAVCLSTAAGGWLRVKLNQRFDRGNQVLDEASIPRPSVARVLSLGHTEWLTDILWINATIYYAETLYARLPAQYVERYATTMQTLDPRFRGAYLWGATALIYRAGVPTLHGVDASISELRRGLEVFPGDPEMTLQLGFDLAFERIRFVSDQPAARAAVRAEGGEYLRQASLMAMGPPWLALTAATMLDESGHTDAAISMLQDVLLRCTDMHLRTQFEARLMALQHDPTGVDPTLAAMRAFEARRAAEMPYIPANVYVFVGAPTVGTAAWSAVPVPVSY